MENFSIVIPVYNEQDNVRALADEITETFRAVYFDWEVIWVDDCSDDETLDVLISYGQMNPKHKVLHLPRRSGQSAAVINGIQVSSFDLIGTLDGDGQNAPYDLIVLKRLLEKTESDLTQGYRIKREDKKHRIISTKLANHFRSKVLGDSFKDVGCAVRVFRKHVIDGLPSFKGWHRFLPVMLSFSRSLKVLEHPVSHRERKGGVSKYGISNRLWVGLFDLVGMIWFKHRMIKVFREGEIEWKDTFTPLALLVNSSSPDGFSSSGLQARRPINQ